MKILKRLICLIKGHYYVHQNFFIDDGKKMYRQIKCLKCGKTEKIKL